MKTLNIYKAPAVGPVAYILGSAITFTVLWHLVPKLIYGYNDAAGMLDSSIWVLLLFTVISFLCLTIACGYLLHCFVLQLGLPKIDTMVPQFKTLTLCQQFAFYWASFALLLLAAVLSLIAVF
jgi:hypothetical protein